MTGRRGRRRKKIVKKRGCWKLKEEALDCALRRSGFGRGDGRVERQTTE